MTQCAEFAGRSWASCTRGIEGCICGMDDPHRVAMVLERHIQWRDNGEGDMVSPQAFGLAMDAAVPMLRAYAAALAQREVRILTGVPTNELRLEMRLRAGPSYQCMNPACRAYEDGPVKWDTCPSCGLKGYLCGSFKLDKESAEFKQWESRTFSKYRVAAAPSDAAPEGKQP
jgi:hypothetical protein